jgi:hypothetical protein
MFSGKWEGSFRAFNSRTIGETRHWSALTGGRSVAFKF